MQTENTMAFQFQMTVTNVKEKIIQIKEKMTQNSMHFEGNEKTGSFKGSGIEGTYEIKKNQVLVLINKKPFYIPESLVESKFKDYFS